MSTLELIEAVAPGTYKAGSAFYFTPETMERGKAAGLDGYRFYFLGRGGVMGDVSGAVMVSAFGYFNPEMVVPMWDTGVETMPASEAAALYWDCVAEHGRSHLADVAGLAEYCAAAEAVVAATPLDGLPLFAGIASQPLADDLPARAYQLTATLRELRGSAHLVALRASGLPTLVAHAIKRPDMVESFGWAEAPEFTDADKATLAAAEAATSQMLVASYSVLDEAAAAALIAGTNAIAAAMPS